MLVYFIRCKDSTEVLVHKLQQNPIKFWWAVLTYSRNLTQQTFSDVAIKAIHLVCHRSLVWEVKRREGKMTNGSERIENNYFFPFLPSLLECHRDPQKVIAWCHTSPYRGWDCSCPGNIPLAAGWECWACCQWEVFAVIVHLFELWAQPFPMLGCWVGPVCRYLAPLCPSPELFRNAEEAGSFTDELWFPLWCGQQVKAQLGTCEKQSPCARCLAILTFSIDLNKWHCFHVHLINQFWKNLESKIV